MAQRHVRKCKLWRTAATLVTRCQVCEAIDATHNAAVKHSAWLNDAMDKAALPRAG